MEPCPEALPNAPGYRRLYLRRTRNFLWPITVLFLLNPVASPLIHMALMACVVGSFVLAMAIAWPNRMLRFALTLFALLLAAPLLLPGRPYNPVTLRNAYADLLSRYEGVPYVPGGEKEWGIDCSGLPRRALMRASVVTGIKDLNGALVRLGLTLWWHDASSRALGQGYRGWTRPLFDSPSVNAIDSSRLLPGDMAVTANGLHVMVYAGGQDWLEANPDFWRVIRVRVPVARHRSFEIPVHVVRWTQLSEQAGNAISNGH